MTNIYNLFKFLEKKKGTKTPLQAKILIAPDKITDEDLNVAGTFDLQAAAISSLPDNLKVEEHIWADASPIDSIPNNLQVGGDLSLMDTPLAEKHTAEEIRKMVEDKGGYVKGEIHAETY